MSTTVAKCTSNQGRMSGRLFRGSFYLYFIAAWIFYQTSIVFSSLKACLAQVKSNKPVTSEQNTFLPGQYACVLG